MVDYPLEDNEYPMTRLEFLSCLGGAGVSLALSPLKLLFAEEAPREAVPPPLVSYGGKYWQVLYRPPQSKANIYFIPNTHIAEDTSRDEKVVQELTAGNFIDAFLPESLSATPTHTPVPIEDKFDVLAQHFQPEFLRTLVDKNVALYGTQDPEKYEKAVEELMETTARAFGALYYSGLHRLIDIEKKWLDEMKQCKEEDKREHTLIEYKKLFEPIYDEIPEEILDKKRLTLEKAGDIAASSGKELKEKMQRYGIEERDTSFAKSLDAAVQQGRKKIAVVYGEEHKESHLQHCILSGYTFYVLQQEEILITLQHLQEGAVQTAEEMRVSMQAWLMLYDYIIGFEQEHLEWSLGVKPE